MKRGDDVADGAKDKPLAAPAFQGIAVAELLVDEAHGAGLAHVFVAVDQIAYGGEEGAEPLLLHLDLGRAADVP